MNKQKITGIAYSLIGLFLFISVSTTASAEQKKRYWVDSFTYSTEGKMPKWWQPRGDKAHLFYKVAKDGKNKFLRVKTRDSAEFIGKTVKVDLVKYPYLNWRWRVNELPPGGNESKKPKCDVPASVNVVLDYNKLFGVPRPKTIKYSWSTTLPVGTITESPFATMGSQVDIKVLRSGSGLKGKWVWQKVNVLEDYKKFYEKDDVDSLVIDAVVIMSDSDSTHTTSAADYDDIFFSTK